ncbi:MAG: hypothetical protein ABH858_00880 [Candidatus Omnitrophota bacterium]
MAENDKKKTGIFVVLIVILLVILVARQLITVTKKKKAPSSKQASASVKDAKSSSGQEGKAASGEAKGGDLLSSQKKRAGLPWGRDPFSLGKIEKSVEGMTFVLKGISLGKDKAGFAFINNQIVKVGDVIGGHKVLEIQKDKVFLSKDEEGFYLELPKEKK